MSPSRFSEMADRLDRLREEMRRLGLDGVVIPRFDAYQGEVVAAHDERLAYISGFTGSAGIAIVTLNEAVLFVDGRYEIQARQEVDPDAFAFSHFYRHPVEDWLAANGRPGSRIGINPMLVHNSLYEKLQGALLRSGGALVELESDLIDAIWSDQPPPPLESIMAFSTERSGEASADKRMRIAAKLRDLGADMLVETQPDNIAWLLNIRGGDIAYTPVVHSMLLLDDQGGVEWFVDERKLPNDRTALELEGVELRPAGGLVTALEGLPSGRSVLIDPGFAPVATRLAVERAGGKVMLQFSPITLTKAVKNEIELAGFRQAHLDDGMAWVEFLAWLYEVAPQRLAAGQPVTEIEAQDQLRTFRQQQPSFLDNSFSSISASGSNAAMCHYSASAASNAPITNLLPYLLDAGGHYTGGTTDTTRTMMLGTPTPTICRAYTAVLKGFIALMTAQFPKGTCGHHLDALARRPLWDLGLDYDHGTGHGVGHVLSVHEHPHRFGKVVNNHPFEPGVVMTIEPGYYAEGAFGLRVENQVEVVPGAIGFLRFRTLTFVPIDLTMAIVAELTPAEIDFLNTYHAQVRQNLATGLSARATDYLVRATAAIDLEKTHV